MNKSYFKKGFTLIELLVVVGILAILAIAALIAINPLEAQRRSRDSARLQDLARLSSAIEAFVNDNGELGLPAGAVNSAAAGLARGQSAVGGHWLDGNGATAGPDFSDYLKQIPLDPQNGRPISYLTGAGTQQNPTRAAAATNAGYGFIITAGDYELCAMLEANKSWELLQGDGTINGIFETGTNTALACDPNGAAALP